MRKVFLFVFTLCYSILINSQNCFGQRGQIFAAVEQNGKWGYIDTTGKVQIPFNLDAAGSFNESVVNVKYGGFWGYIDKKGTFILKPGFNEALPFHNGRAKIAYYDHRDQVLYKGYIRKDGSVITLLENFETGYEYHDGYVRILSRTPHGMRFGFKE